jgi:poly(hydroxyalkanoate) granule-associated protein
MVKKLQKMAAKKDAAASGLFDSQLAGAVKGSAQQIWLAGMGAFAKAQAEGGKVFEALVKEGSRLQRKTQGLAEERLGDVSGRMSAMASDVSSRAGASWDKLEGIFEERTAKALARLGVPTAKDVAALSRRVDELAAAVGKMGKPARGASRAGAADAKAKRARKSAAKGAAKAAAKGSAKGSAKGAVKGAAKASTEGSAKRSVKTSAKTSGKAAAKTAPARKSAGRKPAPGADGDSTA